jgi:hypothetical protein
LQRLGQKREVSVGSLFHADRLGSSFLFGGMRFIRPIPSVLLLIALPGTALGQISIARAVGSNETWTWEIGTLDLGSSEILVGFAGDGTFQQSGGSVIGGASGSGGYIYVGYLRGSAGTYLLSGGEVSVTGEEIGHSGSGVFIHSGGTNTVAETLSLGVTSLNPSGGTYLMSSSGASLIATNEFIGRLAPGTFIQSAGVHAVHDFCAIGYAHSNSRYDLIGGSFSIARELNAGYIGDGSLNQSGGWLTVGTESKPGQLIVGREFRGFYSLSGSAIANVHGNEYVGWNGRGSVVQSDGSHSISDGLDIGGQVIGGASSRFDLRGGTLKVGGKTLVGMRGPGEFNLSGGVFSTEQLIIGNAGTFAWNGGLVSAKAISVGGHMKLGLGSGLTLVANVLKIDPFVTKALDLTDNAAIIDYDGLSPLTAIRQYLRDSRLFTSAAIPGVTTLGYLDDGSVVRVAYTYMGDTDLNGAVDLLDFDHYLDGFAPTEVAAMWITGDFDYSGIVDLADFELYLNGYYALGGSVAAITDAVQNAPVSEQDRAAMLGLVNTVPEPLAMSVLGVIPLLLRRRKKSTTDKHR